VIELLLYVAVAAWLVAVCLWRGEL